MYCTILHLTGFCASIFNDYSLTLETLGWSISALSENIAFFDDFLCNTNQHLCHMSTQLIGHNKNDNQPIILAFSFMFSIPDGLDMLR